MYRTVARLTMELPGGHKPRFAYNLAHLLLAQPHNSRPESCVDGACKDCRCFSYPF